MITLSDSKVVALNILYFLLGHILYTHAGRECLKENIWLHIGTEGRVMVLLASPLRKYTYEIASNEK